MDDDRGGLNVAAELARLRGAMDAGFARLEGSLALISQAQDRAAADLEDLDERVTALESRRWPMGSVATLSGVVSGAVAFAAFTLGK